jgi:tRNA (guanine37-N1)-methyltransferase
MSQSPPPARTDAKTPALRLDIVTIFPDYFAPLSVSLIGKAVERGDIGITVHDLRAWAHDRHRTVDDTPFGGGPGMVMLPEPWGEALDAILAGASRVGRTEAGGAREGSGTRPRLIVPTPAGTLFDQAAASEFASCDHLIFACGRYEGIDARVADYARTLMPVHELSIGDYVLGGGEPAVLVMAEAICRLLPGVLGNAESAPDDSFGAGVGPMHGLIEGPAYTRPRTWRGMDVPDVLLSGNHAAIARWRRDEALRRTLSARPDLAARLTGGALSARDRQVLSEADFAVTGDDVAH